MAVVRKLFLKKRFRLKSLRTKIILSFAGLLDSPDFTGFFFPTIPILEILQQNVRTYTETVINRVERNLQIYLSDLERSLS